MRLPKTDRIGEQLAIGVERSVSCLECGTRLSSEAYSNWIGVSVTWRYVIGGKCGYDKS